MQEVVQVLVEGEKGILRKCEVPKPSFMLVMQADQQLWWRRWGDQHLLVSALCLTLENISFLDFPLAELVLRVFNDASQLKLPKDLQSNLSTIEGNLWETRSTSEAQGVQNTPQTQQSWNNSILSNL